MGEILLFPSSLFILWAFIIIVREDEIKWTFDLTKHCYFCSIVLYEQMLGIALIPVYTDAVN